jgi:hypothetical protein
MNIDRLEALLWARIDGTIDPQELAELEALLAEQPEPREIERQITDIADGLKGIEKVQPPPELRGRIDSALENAAPPEAHHAASLLARPAPSWQRRWAPVAASLVIGVAIGYLLHPGAGSSIDQSGVGGTMLTPTTQLEPAPIDIQLDAGLVSASRSGADVVLDVTMTEEIDLSLTLAGEGGIIRIASLISATESTTSATTEQGWVVLRTRGPGSATLRVSASDTDEPLRLQVSADGVPVDERWIGPSRSEAGP